MSRKTQAVFALVAFLVAVGTGLLAYSWFDRIITVGTVVTPAKTIPAGTLIDSSMLTQKEVPRSLLSENIYINPESLLGKVAVVPLYPGMVVYRQFAVDLKDYRLVDDPSLVVISFPVDPSRAVGGQIQPGHRIDIWGLLAPDNTQAVTVTLVLRSVLVVDVRTSAGQAVSRSPQAVPGQTGTGQQQGQQKGGPLQIITVALPSDRAKALLELIAREERSSGARIWVSLSPVQQEPNGP